MTVGRWLYILPVAIFLMIVAGVGVALMRGGEPSEIPYVMMDTPAPETEMPSLRDGDGTVGGAEIGNGDISLVNVFASWCAPCLAEHPVLTGLAEDHGLPIIGINYRDQKDDALAWLERHGDVYQSIGHDPEGRAGLDWGIQGVPETFVIDGDGRIRYRHAGAVTTDTARTEILPLIQRLREEG